MTNDLPNIWYMQTERDIKGLVGALRHPDPLIRRRAAAALRVVGATNAAKALKAALDAEKDADVRLAMASALDYLTPQQRQPQQPKDQPQSRVERLIQHLTGPRPDLALQAAVALGKVGDLRAVPPLVIVFRNRRQPSNVRLAAARALLAMNSAPAEVTLLGALESEKWHLRRNGAAILGRLEAEWAVEPLSLALYDQNELVARTARAALRRIGTPEAMQALEDAKHAIIDTSDAIDPKMVEKAQRVKEQEKLGNDVTMQIDRGKLANYLEQNRKKGTSDLKPPERKAGTGQLKAPVDSQQPGAKPPIKKLPRQKPDAKPPIKKLPAQQPDAKPPVKKLPAQQPDAKPPVKKLPRQKTAQEPSEPVPPFVTDMPPFVLDEDELPPTPPRPPKPASKPSKERIRSRRRRSSTGRLTDPDQQTDE